MPLHSVQLARLTTERERWLTDDMTIDRTGATFKCRVVPDHRMMRAVPGLPRFLDLPRYLIRAPVTADIQQGDLGTVVGKDQYLINEAFDPRSNETLRLAGGLHVFSLLTGTTQRQPGAMDVGATSSDSDHETLTLYRMIPNTTLLPMSDQFAADMFGTEAENIHVVYAKAPANPSQEPYTVRPGDNLTIASEGFTGEIVGVEFYNRLLLLYVAKTYPR